MAPNALLKLKYFYSETFAFLLFFFGEPSADDLIPCTFNIELSIGYGHVVDCGTNVMFTAGGVWWDGVWQDLRFCS